MTMPKFNGILNNLNLVVYPKFDKGNYSYSINGKKKNIFNKGFIKNIEQEEELINFRKTNNKFPSRLVTGLNGKMNNQKIPFECSLGIAHEKNLAKRFSWGIVSGKDINLIFINKNKIIKSTVNRNLVFKLYNSKNLKVLTKNFVLPKNNEDRHQFNLKEVFPKYKNFLKNEYGYLTLFSKDTSILMINGIFNKQKGLTIEHCF